MKVGGAVVCNMDTGVGALQVEDDGNVALAAGPPGGEGKGQGLAGWCGLLAAWRKGDGLQLAWAQARERKGGSGLVAWAVEKKRNGQGKGKQVGQGKRDLSRKKQKLAQREIWKLN